ncbi:MAG: Sec-independent protein translocase subunit TatA/TatB [Cypionkella sp.]
MFELNWAELLIIGFLALIVIGPEDLPDMFRQLGRFTAKLRQMSREFSRAMEEAAKQSGMKDAADDLKAATSAKSLGLDKVRDAADKFEKWDPIKNAAKPSKPATTMPARTLVPPPMPATPATADAAPVETEHVNLLDDADEAADDLAYAADEHSILSPAHGPATQALYDKQALRASVLQEQTEKLKAIEAGTYAPASPVAHSATAPAAVKSAAEKPGMTKPAKSVPAAAEATKPAPTKRESKAKPVTKTATKAAPKTATKTATKAVTKTAVKTEASPASVTADGSVPEPKKKTSRKTASKADKV